MLFEQDVLEQNSFNIAIQLHHKNGLALQMFDSFIRDQAHSLASRGAIT